MQVYLATLESVKFLKVMPDDYFEYGFISYLYVRNHDEKVEEVLKKCKHLLVDSGAYSLQHSKKKKINMNKYALEYLKFVQRWTDHPKLEGFFEMDVDNKIPLEKIVKFRKILEEVSDKIIPVWHTERGVANYIEMCKEYSGKRVGVTAFGNISDGQYNLFINEAHKYKCNVHILGMTKFGLLKQMNLHKDDSFDSSTWRQNGIYGNVAGPSHHGEFYRLYALSGLRTIADYALVVNFEAFHKLQSIYKDINQSLYFEK